MKLKFLNNKNRKKYNKHAFYKYHVSTSKESFLKVREYDAYKVKCDNDMIDFFTNNKIDDENFMVTNRYNKFFKEKIIKNLIIILSLSLSIIIFFITPLFIRNVTYKEGSYIRDDRILTEVRTKLGKIGPLYYIKEDLNVISADLRSKYIEYAWIELNRKASILEINLEKMDKKAQELPDLSITGDLVARENGYIEKMEIKRGVVLKNIRETVKKGEVLVSGNLYKEQGKEENEKLVHAEGKVLANVISYKNMVVLKNKKVDKYELVKNNVIGFYSPKGYKWFGSPIKYNKFINETLLKIANVELIRSDFYLNKEIMVCLTEDEAFSFARSAFTKEFWEKTKYDEEHIKRFEMISSKEYSDRYEFRCLIETFENIAIFKPHTN